ncbi:putative zinc-type alcohol dehydrogenase-like protein [Pseudarthrobacter defluvii]|uniref:NAD(P)-dependent alcohol dehydrogenase n=1 Tax=Pseudarthrobacter defluvii TaxID=410837 RepID=UPI00278B655A|nr:NAD(P)-dependent alcohol dehydrogenase [Pseudarthrobacter defluvii]MDQ0769446.1 putative zinc-type alcohol dehydrogenase-like protein [Pseudarthrobacter defluvii]
MLTVNAYAATSATEPLIPTTIQRRGLGPHDVLINIDYAGICHSDIHTVRGDWGRITYPQVVGHEIVGHVTEVGSAVSKHKVGDRVGVGCESGSCGSCEQCLKGEEVYCLKGNVQTYNGVDVDGSITQGGYSQAIVVNEDFVLRVPESLDIEKVAPLLCAGVTLYSPLKHWKAGPGTKVAIIGMGGLGHVGVKIAHALGAEVTVLSRTLSKQEDGLKLGADHYHATSDPATFEKLAGSFDLILNTVSAGLNYNQYVNLLAVDGTLVILGAPSEPVSVDAMSLVAARRSIAGSANGGIPVTQEMLDFCAEHNIVPEIELIKASQINEAYERVLASDVRYRFVIDAKTFA